MSAVHRLISFATAMLVVMPVCAGAQLRSIRHLVFHLSMTVQTRQDVRTSGPVTIAGSNADLAMMGVGPRRGAQVSSSRSAGPSNMQSGSGTTHRGAGAAADGNITVDIVAVDADRTLVADVAENTDSRKAPAVRVIVYPDGTIQIGQADIANVTDEEQMLVRMLGRDFVTQRGMNVGHWNVEHALPKGRESDQYRIVSTNAIGDLNLQFDQSMVLNDVEPFDLLAHGTALYSFAKRVPKRATVTLRMRREGGQQVMTTEQNVDFTLLSDSLGDA